MHLGCFCIREAAAETEGALHAHFGYSMCTAPTVEEITDISKSEGWGWKVDAEKVLGFFFQAKYFNILYLIFPRTLISSACL